MSKTAIGAVVSLCAVTAASAPALAQVPPSPYAIVSQLDFECRPAEGAAVVANLFVRQLNPVLQGRIPNQVVPVGALEEVCVPVAKNGQIPGPAARAFIEWMDLACYRAQSPDPDVDVVLSHLNPVLAGLPDEAVEIGPLEQICVPVRKNNSVLPVPVRHMVEHLDLGCYAIEPTADADRTLLLTHLNPVIRAMGLPDRVVDVRRAHQLCVPIAKNAQPVPEEVRDYIEWMDFLKYRVVPAAPIPALPLWLTHLNPLFAGAAPFFTVLQPERVRLMVPVAKDGHEPPGGPGAQ
jgi:hypothetical protein